MSFDERTRRQIYDRTNGCCHICGKKLSIKNYACSGRKGAWEVEHSHARSKGGTDNMNNLFPACIECNRLKGNVKTTIARGWFGRKRAPLSKRKKKEAKVSNAIGGGIIGGFIGALGGPLGVAVGAAIGAKLGYDEDPNEE